MSILKKLVSVSALAVAFAVPATAQSVSRMNTEAGLMAIGTAQEFEVLTQAGAGKVEYYCAAGDFAKRRLGASNTDRVVVTRDVGPSQTTANRQAVGFTLASRDAVDTSSSVTLSTKVGQARSVGHSKSLCGQTRNKRRDKD